MSIKKFLELPQFSVWAVEEQWENRDDNMVLGFFSTEKLAYDFIEGFQLQTCGVVEVKVNDRELVEDLIGD